MLTVERLHAICRVRSGPSRPAPRIQHRKADSDAPQPSLRCPSRGGLPQLGFRYVGISLEVRESLLDEALRVPNGRSRTIPVRRTGSPSGESEMRRGVMLLTVQRVTPSQRATRLQVSKLRVASSREWREAVLGNFDAFLVDHAGCERKASATAMSLVSHYPDRRVLVQEMTRLAREELEHFHQMLWLLQSRDLVLRRDDKDLYVQSLRREIRTGADHYFLDRLIVAGIVEARGCERFGQVAEALEPGKLRDFYREIARSESQHHGVFYRLARRYFDSAEVEARQSALLDREAEILSTLPVRPAVH